MPSSAPASLTIPSWIDAMSSIVLTVCPLIFPPSLGRVRTCGDPVEVERHAGLIADHPGVVAGSDHERVAGPQLDLGPVAHPHQLTSRDDVSDVRHLALFCPGERLDVFRPPPSRL